MTEAWSAQGTSISAICPRYRSFTQGDTVLESIMRDNENETHYSSREEMSATAKSMLKVLGTGPTPGWRPFQEASASAWPWQACS